ncbi:iron-containing alcohol dehydrogenase [Streptomyces sp. NL15-2K]|uniref:iron-containing alcohol dehydrogenase n=1 Tax=Streptomyces sp. NL15-2K TaxID=376149 RepID=UPI001C0EE67E|nr:MULTISPECIES: iron-containing alcohol dehydrogenase [Actinomycetes]WKX06297.1 iron-containing alcohol dehydrogenase [Kutzneria buriramensis]
MLTHIREPARVGDPGLVRARCRGRRTATGRADPALTAGLPAVVAHPAGLPYPPAFNASAAPQAERRIAEAFGAASALGGLQRLRGAVEAPRALRDHGFDEADIDDAVHAILDVVPAKNPCPVTPDSLRRLLRAARQGADPLTTDGQES